MGTCFRKVIISNFLSCPLNCSLEPIFMGSWTRYNARKKIGIILLIDICNEAFLHEKRNEAHNTLILIVSYFVIICKYVQHFLQFFVFFCC